MEFLQTRLEEAFRMNAMSPTPCVTLAGVDWQRAWEELEAIRPTPGGVEHWNKRSSSYGNMRYGDYEQRFLELAQIEPGSTVLDFGCGVGLLAIPLARQGCKVIACDFSQGMLDQLAAHVREAGVEDLVESRLLSWDDDWAAAGLIPDSVDVAIASRSIATPNLEGALRKLDSVARTRVCVTVAAGASPRRDVRAYEAVGRSLFWVPDYAYCLNILLASGVFADLTYIVTHRRPAFDSRADALSQLAEMMGGDLSPEEEARLAAYVDARYVEDLTMPADRTFAARHDCPVRWAFISWGTSAR